MAKYTEKTKPLSLSSAVNYTGKAGRQRTYRK